MLLAVIVVPAVVLNELSDGGSGLTSKLKMRLPLAASAVAAASAQGKNGTLAPSRGRADSPAMNRRREMGMDGLSWQVYQWRKPAW